MNIYEKITAIMQDVQYLAKDDKVEFNSTKYKALSEEKVTSIMRAELLKYSLVVFPVSQIANRSGQITHVDVTYRLVNVENPDEFVEIASCGDGADSQDKGSGKAMTYAYKYMWLRTFALPTGEDPDKISSAELDEKLKDDAPVTPPPSTPKGTAPRPAPEPDVTPAPPPQKCEECGIIITPIKKKDGNMWPASDMVRYSKKRYGKALCAVHMQKAEEKLKAEEAGKVAEMNARPQT